MMKFLYLGYNIYKSYKYYFIGEIMMKKIIGLSKSEVNLKIKEGKILHQNLLLKVIYRLLLVMFLIYLMHIILLLLLL